MDRNRWFEFSDPELELLRNGLNSRVSLEEELREMERALRNELDAELARRRAWGGAS